MISVTSAYFRPTSASGSDAGSTCKNGGSNAGEHPILAEVSFTASLKSLLFKRFLAEVGGSKAEVNPRTPLLLLPPARNSSKWEEVRRASV